MHSAGRVVKAALAAVMVAGVPSIVSRSASASAAGTSPPPPSPPTLFAPPPTPSSPIYGQITTGGTGIIVGAGSETSSLGSSGHGGESSGGASSSCQWVAQGSQGPSNPGIGGYSDGPNGPTPVAGTVAGTWYLEVCPGAPGGLFFIPAGSPPTAVVSPRQLATEAVQSLQAPVPALQMSPPTLTNPNAWQYVNIPTWVWVATTQWVALHATASVPGVSVTATAVPIQLVLTYQAGGGVNEGAGATEQVVCDGPGTPYSAVLAAAENPQQPIMAASPDCGWTWERSAAGSADEKLQVTATIVYKASWAVSGAAGGGGLGTINSPTATYQVTVGEIESLNTGGP